MNPPGKIVYERKEPTATTAITLTTPLPRITSEATTITSVWPAPTRGLGIVVLVAIVVPVAVILDKGSEKS